MADGKVPIAFSHHSHSGQFCGHASNKLEDVVQNAIGKGMTMFCLTEHIPRKAVDFYPGESDEHSEGSLVQLYDDFYHEARRLQTAYASQIQLFVGFESEWIREYSLPLVQGLLTKYPVDLFVGSVHHVHTVPIDYDTPMYHQAREIAGGSDERVFEDYFEAQYEMLKALHPPLVGHFDLIRLQSDDPERSFRSWPGVWGKLERNLRFVAAYGGVLELNSSSLRKGMSEAYPQVEICKAFKDMGGRFTVSDDSHGCEHVGLNYDKVLDCIRKAGIEELCHLTPAGSAEPLDVRFPSVRWERFNVAELPSV